ncbi:ham1 family protein [Mycobacterium intracellulare]|nr:ham1 family protein [Mycobacterium intracellulare]
MHSSRLLVASRNPKKLAELRRVLDAAGLTGLTLVSLDDVAPFEEAPETGATFEENALAKARDAFTASGLPSVADDSGLEVAALNGMPGVLSARWSGNHGDDAGNTALLLAQMRDVPDERRGAAFVSACALVSGAGEVVVRANGPAASPGNRAAMAVSGMTPCSCPTGTSARRPSSARARRTRSRIAVARCNCCCRRLKRWPGPRAESPACEAFATFVTPVAARGDRRNAHLLATTRSCARVVARRWALRARPRQGRVWRMWLTSRIGL